MNFSRAHAKCAEYTGNPSDSCETSSRIAWELYDAQRDNNLTIINKRSREASLRASVTSCETLSRLSPGMARVHMRPLFDRGARRHSNARYRANLSQVFSAAQ